MWYFFLGNLFTISFGIRDWFDFFFSWNFGTSLGVHLAISFEIYSETPMDFFLEFFRQIFLKFGNSIGKFSNMFFFNFLANPMKHISAIPLKIDSLWDSYVKYVGKRQCLAQVRCKFLMELLLVPSFQKNDQKNFRWVRWKNCEHNH